MDEFEIGEFAYRAGKMDAMTQFQVTRKLAPVLASFKDVDNDTGDFIPVAEAIAKLDDAVVEYVIACCLAVVSRKQLNGTGWAAIWDGRAKRPMFEDIDMSIMLNIVRRVLQGNIGSFSSALR